MRRSMSEILIVLAVVGIPGSNLGQLDLSSDPSKEIREILRTRIEQVDYPPHITVGEEVIHALVDLQLFYERRLFQPAWVDADGHLPAAEALVWALREAVREGLRPADYHLGKIEDLLRRLGADNRPLRGPLLADLDLLLTDSFLSYGNHLQVGCVNPETYQPESVPVRREADLTQLLQSAIESNRVPQALEGLLPAHPGYARLRSALIRYREIAAVGGWLSIPEGPTLRPAGMDERVLLLRRRLIATGDLEDAPSDAPDRFDEEVERAVRRFQARHGLEPDGVIGPKTLSVLNVPAQDLARQLELNMDRWRWLTQELGQRYILVNIPDFKLKVVEDGKTVLTMAVVVGRTYRSTPVFSDTVRYMVLNPSWGIPRSIAVRDKLPRIREDLDYLARQKIRVYHGWGADQREIDPSEVDWSKLSAGHFPFRLRQEPGPQNALGKVKFMFPNKFNVYLHDTPSPELFARTTRDFSSGCIRLERPLDLAEYVMEGSPAWNRAALVAAIEVGEEKTVPLPRPIAVHLQYWTTWVEADGTVQFRQDLYGRDKKLDEALPRRASVKTQRRRYESSVLLED